MYFRQSADEIAYEDLAAAPGAASQAHIPYPNTGLPVTLIRFPNHIPLMWCDALVE